MIKFGTAGIRGVMEEFGGDFGETLLFKIVTGHARYLLKKYPDRRVHVAIGYDTRKNSKHYAVLAAEWFKWQGIGVFTFESYVPTPLLAFAVTTQRLIKAGVMITASHNGKEYNGYKVFKHNSAQIGEDEAKQIQDEINNVDVSKILESDNTSEITTHFAWHMEDIRRMFFDDIFNHYKISGQVKSRILYSPLNGTGLEYIEKVLKNAGAEYTVLPTHANPDENFTACPMPNPEIDDNFTELLEYTRDFRYPVIIVTDPDADRVRIAVLDKKNKKYVLLSGNQMGCILLNYLSGFSGKFAVTTKVSTPLFKAICEDKGIDCYIVDTGFKNMAKKIMEKSERLLDKDFVFAFEEAIGFLPMTHILDKDSISTVHVIMHMLTNIPNEDILEYMNSIYEKYGFYLDRQINKEVSADVIKTIRDDIVNTNGGCIFNNIKDFTNENVCIMQLDDGSMVCFRESGTEPKFKFYLHATDKDKNIAQKKLDQITEQVENYIEKISK